MEKRYIFYISALVLAVVLTVIFFILLTRKKRCPACPGCPLLPLDYYRQPGCPKYSLPKFPFNFGGFTRDMGTKVPSQNNPFIGINTEIWTFFSFEMTPDKKDLNITYKYGAGLDDAIKRLQCTKSSKNPTKVWLGGLASNMPGRITPLKDFILILITNPGGSDTLLNKFVSKVKEALVEYKCYGVSIDWEVDFEDPNIKKDAEKIWNVFVLLISKLYKNKIPVRMEVLPYEGGHYFTREIIKKLDPYVEYWDLMFYDYAGGNTPGYNSPLDGLICPLENYWMGPEGLNISPSKMCVILPMFGYIWPNPTIDPSGAHGWKGSRTPGTTPELVDYSAGNNLPGGKCQDSRPTPTWQTISSEDVISPSVMDKWFYDFNNFPDINKKYVTYSETHNQPTFAIPIGTDPGIIDPDDSSKKMYGKTQGYVGIFEDERSMAAKTDYLISVYKKYGSFGGILVWSLNNDKVLPDKTIEYVMVNVISKTLTDNL